MTAPRLLSAAPVGSDSVLLTFDQAMGGTALLVDSSYGFDGGLRVSGVSPVMGHTEQVLLLTTPQVDSRGYIVFVSTAVTNSTGEGVTLGQSSVAFVGSSSVSEYVVKDLVARSNLEGRKIDLYWNEPEGAAVQTVVIIRRERAWVFDLTDSDCTVVYNGVAAALQSDLIGGFGRTFTDTGLRDMTYYYYTVAVSASPAASLSSLTVGPESRTYAISTASLDSKEWLRRKGMIPKHWFTADMTSPANYTLDKILTITGAWLDMMRSHMKAGQLQGVWSDAPFPSLADLNRSIGFEPEGESYDFDTLRRTLLQMRAIFATLGRKSAVVAAVWSLVEWTADVQELGIYERSRVFGTYNPDSIQYRALGTTVGEVGYGYASDVTPQAVSPSNPHPPPWTPGQWTGARMVDFLGNWFDVLSNTTDTITTDLGSEADEAVSTTTAVVTGDHTVSLDSVVGIVVGQRVCIRNPANDTTSVLAIVAVDGPTKTLTFWNTTPVSFPLGSLVTWRILAPQLQYIGEVATGALNSLEVDLQGGTSGWAIDQWIGLVVRDSAGTLHTVTSSDSDTLYFSDGLVIPSGIFQLAQDFIGVDPTGSFQIVLGDQPTLYNPMWDRGLMGTRFDPFFYLYGGYTGRLRGAWGPCDLGVFITTPTATLYKGRVEVVVTTTITDTTLSLTVNALVGSYLNPNQSQEKLFKIVSNTATTITVSGDVSRIALVGQAYVVFTPRNAQRYQRLQARITEFVEDGIRPHILFL